MGSKRLPGKMFLPVNNKPMLLFMLDRLATVYNKNDLIVATSTNQLDDRIEDVCNENGYVCYRGSEENVFSRFRDLSQIYQDIDHFIRLTGDNPMVNLMLIKNILYAHVRGKHLFSSTREVTKENIVRYSPKGQSVDIMSTKTFIVIPECELSDFDKEHVIPIFYRMFKCNIFRPLNEDELISISVDELADYLKLKYIIKDI